MSSLYKHQPTLMFTEEMAEHPRRWDLFRLSRMRGVWVDERRGNGPERCKGAKQCDEG